MQKIGGGRIAATDDDGELVSDRLLRGGGALAEPSFQAITSRLHAEGRVTPLGASLGGSRSFRGVRVSCEDGWEDDPYYHDAHDSSTAFTSPATSQIRLRGSLPVVDAITDI